MFTISVKIIFWVYILKTIKSFKKADTWPDGIETFVFFLFNMKKILFLIPIVMSFKENTVCVFFVLLLFALGVVGEVKDNETSNSNQWSLQQKMKGFPKTLLSSTKRNESNNCHNTVIARILAEEEEIGIAIKNSNLSEEHYGRCDCCPQFDCRNIDSAAPKPILANFSVNFDTDYAFLPWSQHGSALHSRGNIKTAQLDLIQAKNIKCYRMDPHVKTTMKFSFTHDSRVKIFTEDIQTNITCLFDSVYQPLLYYTRKKTKTYAYDKTLECKQDKLFEFCSTSYAELRSSVDGTRVVELPPLTDQANMWSSFRLKKSKDLNAVVHNQMLPGKSNVYKKIIRFNRPLVAGELFAFATLNVPLLEGTIIGNAIASNVSHGIGCPYTPCTEDKDGDGVYNCVDECDDNPLLIEKGVCGCNELDVDSDEDGYPDCIDGCPYNPNLHEVGPCGCEDCDTIQRSLKGDSKNNIVHCNTSQNMVMTFNLRENKRSYPQALRIKLLAHPGYEHYGFDRCTLYSDRTDSKDRVGELSNDKLSVEWFLDEGVKKKTRTQDLHGKCIVKSNSVSETTMHVIKDFNYKASGQHNYVMELACHDLESSYASKIQSRLMLFMICLFVLFQ